MKFSKLRPSRSILARAIWGDVALVTFAIAALTGMFVMVERDGMRRQLTLRANAVASFAAAQSEFAMLVGDRAALERLASAALSGEDVVFVEFTQDRGVVRFNRPAETGRNRMPAAPLVVSAAVLAPAETALMDWKPAPVRRELGSVRIGMSVERQDARLAASIRRSLAVALGCLAITLVLQIRQLRRLLEPLHGLIRFTDIIGRGDLSRRAPVSRTDEIGQLGQAFNRMVQALGTTTVSRDYVDGILRSMGEALIVVDTAGIVRTVNPAAQELLGYSAPDLEGSAAEAVLSGANLPPTPAQGLEIGYRHRSGLEIPVLLTSAPLRGPDGVVRGSVWVAQNMTERKRVYEELVAARDTAEQANRAKSQFLANMSHELRTPLNAVIGYSELLMDECRDRALEDLVPDLERIRSSGNHLLRLVEDVLDLSKIEAGRMQVQNELFDVAGAIRDVVAMVRPAADRNGNRLSVEADTTLGRICADEAKFRQSLLNLMSNACKFTEGGVVSVSAARTVAHGAEWLHVRVADTGIGIASEHLSKLFLSFSQADGTVTRRYGGTGLGLAITRRFCQMMGGDVSVQTELGRGSTFTITLPAQPAQSLEGVGA